MMIYDRYIEHFMARLIKKSWNDSTEGEALAEIVAIFAHDHDAWQDAFFNAWEKMGINGYEKEMLTEGPTNGQLLAPFMH